MSKMCERCYDRPVADPEWDLRCPECEHELNMLDDDEDAKRLMIEHDDGPCDCQSCLGYPDNFKC